MPNFPNLHDQKLGKSIRLSLYIGVPAISWYGELEVGSFKSKIERRTGIRYSDSNGIWDSQQIPAPPFALLMYVGGVELLRNPPFMGEVRIFALIN